MQSSSHQSSATAVPLGPSTSTSRNSKLDQIIQVSLLISMTAVERSE